MVSARDSFSFVSQNLLIMKIHTLIFIFLLATGAIFAQTTNVTLQKGFDLKVAGTSTLHDWESTIGEATGSAVLDLDNEAFNGIVALNLKISAKSITSTKGRIMDNKTHDALLAEKHPYVTFQLMEVMSMQEAGDAYNVTTKGKLTIAGVTKVVTLKSKAYVHNNGVRFTGSYPMKMTTFGIDPPTAMLGTLKTGDDITIHYNVNFQ